MSSAPGSDANTRGEIITFPTGYEALRPKTPFIPMLLMKIDRQTREAVPIAEPAEEVDKPSGEEPWRWRDWIAALALFVATAAVVLWQNTRLGVLWDLSYILENAHRISLGDMPYRDFVLPYAPLTFLTQAALIKLTGRVFFHHVLYCAVEGGAATVLTWQILLNLLLRGQVKLARMVAFLLSAPLTVLGIYCIFPHPFYDPDCTFVVLICIVLLQRLERRGFSPLPAFFTGVLLVVPLFVKQNTGLAFLGSAALGLAVLLGINLWQRRPVRGLLWVLLGAAVGLLSALLLIHLTAGLANYKHWTIQFAASRRMPPLVDMLAVYQNPMLPWWIALFLAGALLLWFKPGSRWLQPRSLTESRAVSQGSVRRPCDRKLALLSGLLLSSPFLWVLIRQFVETEPAERAESLLALWPFLLIASFVSALLSVRRRRGIALVLPFVLIGTIHGAFLSQQLWGSTYAIWPLLMLLLADTITVLFPLSKDRTGWRTVSLAAAVALSMVVSGGFYLWSHERLDYANLSDGAINRSSLPALKGLSLRGPWLPQFEELLRFSEREIPRQDGILMIPGEDLFYYSSGRHPGFPVLMFDHTVNPYGPEAILQLSRERDIRWLIVKRELQLRADPVEQKNRMLELLRHDFQMVASLGNYDVYRKKSN